jgi:hypothetical protein
MRTSEEFGELMPKDTFRHFHAHFIGVGVIVIYAGIGALLLKFSEGR